MAVDRNTGLATGRNSGNDQSFMQVQGTSPTNVNSQTQSSQKQVSSQSQSGRSYTMNTTPGILTSLEKFIAQMSDSNNVSEADLDSKAPLPYRTFKSGVGSVGYSGGWVYIDPKTGQTLNDEAGAKLLADRTKEREQITSSAGITPGGTSDQRFIADARKTEIGRTREQQGKYSKEAAMADASQLSNYFARVLSEQQMPGILRGAEGAGASQGSMRTLLTQQAIARTGEIATKVGTDLGVAYGGINANLEQVLEALTRQDPNSISNQLLQALSIGKGIVQDTTSSQATSGVSNTSGSQNTQQQNSGKVEATARQFDSPSEGVLNNLGAPATSYAPSANAGTGYWEMHDPYSNTNFINAPAAGEDFSSYDESNFF